MSNEQRSTTAKYRVGDIVEHTGGEYTVVEVPSDTTQLLWIQRAPHNPGGVRPEACTLRRRPVQVGDVLCPRTVPKHRFEVTAVEPDVFRGLNQGEKYDLRVRDLASFGGWTHADGTPVEPPAPRGYDGIVVEGQLYMTPPQTHRVTSFGAARGAPQSYSAMQAAADQASMYLGGQNENRGGSACIQNAYQHRPSYETSSVCCDDTCEAGKRWRSRAAEADQRASAANDENGELREGIVVFHVASQALYKVTIEKDEEPKGRPA